jgi:hypothetical protein
MTEITFAEIVALVDQLSPQDQTSLTAYLLDAARKRKLSADEKMKLLRSIQIDAEVLEEPSIRREDWYGDDGR